MMFSDIDIHGYTAAEARKLLVQKINAAPSGCEITVIHGYHGGQALQKMVRNDLKHPRIKRKILGLNQGETILVIE